MSKDALEFVESMSSAEIKELAKVKSISEKIDLDALEKFDIDPKDWALEDLVMLSNAAVNAVKDGRATLKLPTYIRLEPIYKLALQNMKPVSGANFTQILTALCEAILTGDLVVERRQTTKAEEREYKQKYRTLLRTRSGIVINTTNYAKRPVGVKL